MSTILTPSLDCGTFITSGTIIKDSRVWHFLSLQVWHSASCKILYETLHHFVSMTQSVWHKNVDLCSYYGNIMRPYVKYDCNFWPFDQIPTTFRHYIDTARSRPFLTRLPVAAILKLWPLKIIKCYRYSNSLIKRCKYKGDPIPFM